MFFDPPIAGVSRYFAFGQAIPKGKRGAENETIHKFLHTLWKLWNKAGDKCLSIISEIDISFNHKPRFEAKKYFGRKFGSFRHAKNRICLNRFLILMCNSFGKEGAGKSVKIFG